jgi:hypothetical protein
MTAHLSIAIVRATHLCLQGSHVPAFKDGAGALLGGKGGDEYGEDFKRIGNSCHPP